MKMNELDERWLSEWLWKREKRDQLWEEDEERREELRPVIAIAAGAAAGGGIPAQVTLSVTKE